MVRRGSGVRVPASALTKDLEIRPPSSPARCARQLREGSWGRNRGKMSRSRRCRRCALQLVDSLSENSVVTGWLLVSGRRGDALEPPPACRLEQCQALVGPEGSRRAPAGPSSANSASSARLSAYAGPRVEHPSRWSRTRRFRSSTDTGAGLGKASVHSARSRAWAELVFLDAGLGRVPSNLTSQAQPAASHRAPQRASIGETKRGVARGHRPPEARARRR